MRLKACERIRSVTSTRSDSVGAWVLMLPLMSQLPRAGSVPLKRNMAAASRPGTDIHKNALRQP